MKTKIKEKFKNIYTEFKKDKVLQIALVFAIISAILGCVDLKVNASESGYEVVSVKTEHRFTDTSGTTYVSGFPLTQAEQWTFSSESPISVYYYNTSDTVTTTSDYKIFIYYVSDSPLYAGESPAGYSTTVNGKTVYYCASNSTSRNYSSNAGYCTMDFQGASKVYRLTDVKYYTATTFVTALQNGTLEYKQEIDYDSFEIDNDMPVITDMQANRIQNWVSADSYNQYFDYITWKNSGNYEVQIKKVFTVYFMKKVDGSLRILGTEHSPNTVVDEIYESGVTSFTQQTDESYILSERSDDYEFYSYIAQNNEYENWTHSSYGFQYAIRYVDIENEKAGRWSLVMPIENIGDLDQKFTFSYVLEDGSTSENIILGGTNEEFTDIWDFEEGLDFAKDTIDSENQFKEEYEIVDGDVDIQEATNWLNTVVSFIKGTPQVVGSVLGFLPQPILYGMYVTVFLGVIASAIAIVKALF